jgi:hypothetical protein
MHQMCLLSGRLFRSPRQFSKNGGFAYINIPFCPKTDTYLPNKTSKLGQRGLVQNCRGDKKSRPDNVLIFNKCSLAAVLDLQKTLTHYGQIDSFYAVLIFLKNSLVRYKPNLGQS